VEWFIVEVTAEDVKREREKARALRKTQWWSNRLDRGLCHYCGQKFPRDALSMDHVVPVIRGGKSTRGNCVPACKDCNNRKKYLLPIEWEEYLQKLGRPAGGGPDSESED